MPRVWTSEAAGRASRWVDAQRVRVSSARSTPQAIGVLAGSIALGVIMLALLAIVVVPAIVIGLAVYLALRAWRAIRGVFGGRGGPLGGGGGDGRENVRVMGETRSTP